MYNELHALSNWNQTHGMRVSAVITVINTIVSEGKVQTDSFDWTVFLAISNKKKKYSCMAFSCT